MVPHPPNITDTNGGGGGNEVFGLNETLIMSLPTHASAAEVPSTMDGNSRDSNGSIGGGSCTRRFNRSNLLGREQGFYELNGSAASNASIDEGDMTALTSPKLLITSSPMKKGMRKTSLSPMRPKQSVALESRIKMFESSSSNSFKGLDVSYNSSSFRKLGSSSGPARQLMALGDESNHSLSSSSSHAASGVPTTPSAIIQDRIKIFDSSRNLGLTSPTNGVGGSGRNLLVSPTSSSSAATPSSSGNRSLSKRNVVQSGSNQRSSSANRLPSFKNLNEDDDDDNDMSLTSASCHVPSTPTSMIKDRIKIFDSSRNLGLLSPTGSSHGGGSGRNLTLSSSSSHEPRGASKNRLSSLKNLPLMIPGGNGSLTTPSNNNSHKQSVIAMDLKNHMMASPLTATTTRTSESSHTSNNPDSGESLVDPKIYNELVDRPPPKHLKELYKLQQDLKRGRVKTIATECFSRCTTRRGSKGRSWLENLGDQTTNASNRIGGLPILKYLSPEEIQQKKRQALRKDLEWTLKNAWKRMKNQELLKSKKRSSSIHMMLMTNLNLATLNEVGSLSKEKEVMKQRKMAIKEKNMEWNLRNNAWKNVGAKPLTKEFMEDFKPPVHRKSEEQIETIHHAMSKSFVLKDVHQQHVRRKSSIMMKDAAETSSAGDGSSISSATSTESRPSRRLPSNLQDEVKEAIQNRIEIVTSKSAVPLKKEFLDAFKAPIHAKDANQMELIQRAMFKSVVLKDCISAARGRREGRAVESTAIHCESDDGTDICDTLIQAMEPIEVSKGQVIVEQGMGGTDYFIVSEGEFDFTVDGKVVGKAKRGDSFFDLNLLYNAPHPATVVAASSSSKLFRVDQQTFRGIMETAHRRQKPSLGPLVEDTIREEDEEEEDDDDEYDDDVVGELGMGFGGRTTKAKEEYRMSMFGVQESVIMMRRAAIQEAVQSKVGLNDLEKISLLGGGQFGEVWLVQATILDEEMHRFALKSQYREDEMRGESTEDTIRREIDVLKQLQHPFICNLIHEYEDQEHIHILLGLVSGGELWDLVHQEDEDGNWSSGLSSEEDAKFYSLVIADTLAFMHSKRYIYRDLKPENVMIDADGYPILVDFGFAKQLPTERSKTFTFCGTPNYVSPEIIKNCGHNAGADHWALGCLVYEFLSGQNPFYYDGMDTTELFRTICDDMYYGMDDGQASSDALELIDLLLTKDPAQRIGMLRDGSRDILEHQWFDGIDIVKLRQKQLPAPWIPGSTDEEDETFLQENDNDEETDGIVAPDNKEASKRECETDAPSFNGRWVYGEGEYMDEDDEGADVWGSEFHPGIPSPFPKPMEVRNVAKDMVVEDRRVDTEVGSKPNPEASEPFYGRWVYGESDEPEDEEDIGEAWGSDFNPSEAEPNSQPTARDVTMRSVDGSRPSVNPLRPHGLYYPKHNKSQHTWKVTRELESSSPYGENDGSNKAGDASKTAAADSNASPTHVLGSSVGKKNSGETTHIWSTTSYELRPEGRHLSPFAGPTKRTWAIKGEIPSVRDRGSEDNKVEDPAWSSTSYELRPEGHHLSPLAKQQQRTWAIKRNLPIVTSDGNQGDGKKNPVRELTPTANELRPEGQHLSSLANPVQRTWTIKGQLPQFDSKCD